MAQGVSFNINLKVNGEDRVRNVTMDMDELRKAIDSTRTETQRFTDSLVQINQHVEAVRNIASGFQQLATTLSDLTEESRQYSTAMAAANTMAGKSGSDFAQLKGEVSELAKTIPIARDLLANGLYQVISNGVPEDNWIDYLEKSAKASVGGLANLEEVVKVTSTVIKNYGLSWDEAGTIQDQIQLTAKNGVTSFEQMAQALPRVTANAATLGVSVNELMATFATLTGVSGNTAEVSTQLAAIFTALVKPSSEAGEMAQQMGIKFDAAAVKAAGGMQNFLQSLDQDVKKYAASSGMLEQEIYGKLFGSAESLRALIPLTGKLADTFNKNVDEMKNSAGTIDDAFDEMSDTGSAKLQLLKNAFAEIGDVISGATGWFQPFLNFGAQAGMTIAGVVSLSTAFKGVSISAKLASAAMAAFGPIVKVCRATMTGATVSAQTLRLAIRSLMITTGVGIAVAALTEALNYFCNSADEASEKADHMKESEDAYQHAAAETKASIDEEIRKLKNLIDAKKDTTQEIKHLNSAYGTVFGSHKTAADWYDTLTKKSQIYVKQIGYEAQAKVLASKLAEKEIKLEDNFSKRRDLWANGGAVKTTKHAVIDVQTDKVSYYTVQTDTDEYTALKKEARELIPEINELKRQLGIAQSKMEECAKEMQNVVGGGGAKTIEVAKMNLSQVEKAIEETETKLKSTTDKNTISQLKSYEQQLQARKKDLEKQTGISSYTSTKPEPKFYKNPKDEHELSKNISYYEGKLNGQDTEEQRQLVKNIQLWKQKRAEIELAKKAALVPAELNTAQDVNAKLDYLKAKREIAKQNELPEIDKEIAKAELRELEIQRPKSVDANSTEDDINREIAYQQKLKATSEGSTTAIDKEIKRLERLKDTRTELQIMQDELQTAQEGFDNALTVEAKVEAKAKVDEIQAKIDEATNGRLTIKAETEPTYVVQGSMADKRQSYANAQTKASRIQEDFEIGLIGKEEAQAQIADLNKQLESLGAGLKPIEIDVDSKSFEKAMGRIKDAWSGVQGIGDGVENITSALEGDKNAWEAISGVISGFISIAEGIQGIVTVVKMLTGATQAHTVAKTAEATATGTSTAATIADTAASAANTAVKSGEAVAEVTKSGAQLPFPANLAAIAAGIAAVVAALALVGSFATGGVVGGTSFSGDKLMARVNSGEMILNAQQQARLFAIANGAAVYGAALGIGSEWQDGLKPSEVKAQLQTLQRLAIEGQTGTEQRIRLKVRGRDLIEASGNELRSTRKRSNLR
jgi:TP901 family phage tail tape measure protein